MPQTQQDCKFLHINTLNVIIEICVDNPENANISGSMKYFA